MENLKKARKAKGWSLEQLAAQVGINRSNIFCYEKGSKNPSAPVLSTLADALETTTDYLLGRTEKEVVA